MSRGRRAKPTEVKALLGNPGKRRLALKSASGGARPPSVASDQIDAPNYLTQPREQAAFKWALEYLPANIVRHTDVHALARWAAWLNTWVTCKLALDGREHWYTTRSKFGADDKDGVALEIHREHPLAKRMDKAEAHLITLEDRLCLNIVARNNVMHRLFNMPGAHPAGGLFGADPSEDEKPGETGVPTAKTGEGGDDIGPLAFVERAGRPTH